MHMTEQATNISLQWSEVYSCLVLLWLDYWFTRTKGEGPTKINNIESSGTPLAFREEKTLVMKENSLLGWL